MDRLDVQILRTMDILPYCTAPRDPNLVRAARLAQELGTTRDTVKGRLERLRENGVILGYQCMPNLNHLGLTNEGYLFTMQDADAKIEILDSVRRIPGIMGVHDYLGDATCIDFAHQGPQDRARILTALATATGDRDPQPFFDGAMPPISRDLGALDWRIIQTMRWRAERSVSDIADLLGVSARTVKRRRDRMAQEGSFVLYPMLDPGRAAGLILFELLCYSRPGASDQAARALMRHFSDELLYGYVPGSPNLGNFNLLMFAENPAAVEAIRRRAAAQPGVARVEAWMFRRFYDESAWLDHHIERLAGRDGAPVATAEATIDPVTTRTDNG